MKTDEILILALAGVAAWLIVKAGKVGAGSTAAATRPAGWVSEIFALGGGAHDNGWRYFDDGTAIDPQGCYWNNGVRVWCP